MKRRFELTRFVRVALLAAVGRSVWLIVVFALGAVALEVLANFVYDLVIAGVMPAWATVVRVVVLLVVLAVAAYAFFLLDRRRAVTVGSRVHTATIAPHPGLIWLLSPGKTKPLVIAMRHHASPTAPSESRLRHCWVVLTDAAKETYEDLQAEMERHGIAGVELYPVPLVQADIEHTCRAVARVYDDIDAYALQPHQVVTDLTGGFKTMTAGALLACLPYDRPMEYLLSERDASGEPIPGSERPAQVDVEFFVQKEAKS